MTTTEPLVRKVDFVSVPTGNFDASVDFYGTTLELPRSAYNRERSFAEFETGNVTLLLWNPGAMGMPHTPNTNPVALHVDDIEEARGRLEARGVSFNGETFDTGVCHMATFADPEGNALMLHHRYAPRA